MERKALFLLFLKNKKNMQVRSQLIELHYPLVHKIVQKFNYYPRVLTKEDLFQEGLLGLMKALDYYQDLGYDFLAYARPHIQKAISETIRKINGSAVFSFQENAYYPLTLPTYNPHQVWLKQVNHEIWLNKLKKTLSQAEFQIIRFSYGISYGNVKENYQPIYKNNDIAKMLNLSLKQVEIYKSNAIQKLKKIYRKNK